MIRGLFHADRLARLSLAAGFALALLAALAGLNAGSAATHARSPAPAQGNGAVITIGLAYAPHVLPEFVGHQANAVQLAVDGANARGGVVIGGVPHTVALVRADSGCNPTQAIAAAGALLDGGAVAALGHTCSSATRAALPVYAAAGVPLVIHGATAPYLTDGGYANVFRVISRDDTMPIYVTVYLYRHLNVRRVALIEREGFWGNWGHDGIETKLVELGGELTSRRSIASNDEFTDTLAAIQAEGVDGIFYGEDNGANAALLTDVARRLGMHDVWIVWNTFTQDQGVLNDYAASVSTSAGRVLAVMFYRSPAQMPGYPAFDAAYVAAGFPDHGDNPGMEGAFAYDATSLVLDAIRRADSADPSAIRDALASTASFPGVAGTYRGFDPNGDVIPQWGWLELFRSGSWISHQFGPQPRAWRDGFAETTLHTRWSWIREDPFQWSLTDQPGQLQITTQAGGIFWTFNNSQRNLLMTVAPAGDFRITTRLTITPTENVQQAGILIYADDDNYVRLNRAHLDGDVVEFISEFGASPTWSSVEESATRLNLRIERQGNVYRGYYSLNGVDWIGVGQCLAEMEIPLIGVGANHDLAETPAIPAAFEFFELDDGRSRAFLPWAER